MGDCQARPVIKGFEDILKLLNEKNNEFEHFEERDNDVSPETAELSVKLGVFGSKRKNAVYSLIGKITSNSDNIYYLKPMYQKKKKGEDGPGYVDTDKSSFKIIVENGKFSKE